MTPPDTIPFSSIDLGSRGRSEYLRIPELAQSILDNGLIQPIVLVPADKVVTLAVDNGASFGPQHVVFGLDAGGRRYHALKLLLERGDWDGVLHHASTSDPERPGYILKGEAFSSPFQRAMTELAENLDRSDPDWRDMVKMVTNAWRLARIEKHANGEEILMRDFGAMIGVEYSKLQAALYIHDDVITHPERYKECTSVRGAHAKLMKVAEVALTNEQARRSIVQVPRLVEASSLVSVQSEPEPIQESRPTVIPLTSAFLNCNSLEYMVSLAGPTFDHIITDPDYGVSVERLEANMDTADGVHQTSTYDSLNDLKVFIIHAWRVIKDQGFLVFWYDMDHHNMLQQWAIDVGFAVQRWPLIWIKSDYLSNAAPAFNFTKNFETAMVCRKPNAVLSQVQKYSTFNCSSGATTRDLGHPFAKPLDVWKWLFSACTIKGQTVFDPFAGVGSSCIAATQFGLKSVGCELNPDHYSRLLLNMQEELKKLLGGNVTFS